MRCGVRVTTQYIDLDTGEPLADQVTVKEGIPYDEFDFTTRAGVLTPFDKLEDALLEAGHDSMAKATEQFIKRVSGSKKKH